MGHLEYRSFSDLSELVSRSAAELDRDADLVVGVPRSGMVPAFMIGLYLNRPVIDLAGFLEKRPPSGGKRLGAFSYENVRKVLIVDDSVQFGGQMSKVRALTKPVADVEFKYLAVYGSVEGKAFVDHVFEVVPSPRVFEWNILNSWIYEYSCVDIDGVLCEDPTEEQNDDGPNYRRFLLEAKPKFIPPAPVYALVTSRLEKYRAETETWLRNNGITFRHLVMLDLPDKATRVRLGVHGSFKAEVYERFTDAYLFIESNQGQARAINSITGRPVFSVENMAFYRSIKSEATLGQYFKKVLKRLIN